MLVFWITRSMIMIMILPMGGIMAVLKSMIPPMGGIMVMIPPTGRIMTLLKSIIMSGNLVANLNCHRNKYHVNNTGQ